MINKEEINGRYLVYGEAVCGCSRLKLSDKGLLLVLLGASEESSFSSKRHAENAPESPATIARSLRRLENNGFLKWSLVKDSRGAKIIGSEIVLVAPEKWVAERSEKNDL